MAHRGNQSDAPGADSTPVGNLVGFFNEKVDVLGVQITMQF